MIGLEVWYINRGDLVPELLETSHIYLPHFKYVKNRYLLAVRGSSGLD